MGHWAPIDLPNNLIRGVRKARGNLCEKFERRWKTHVHINCLICLKGSDPQTAEYWYCCNFCRRRAKGSVQIYICTASSALFAEGSSACVWTVPTPKIPKLLVGQLEKPPGQTFEDLSSSWRMRGRRRLRWGGAKRLTENGSALCVCVSYCMKFTDSICVWMENGRLLTF